MCSEWRAGCYGFASLDGGINRKTLYSMRDAGAPETITRGLYRLTSLDPLAHPDLVTVATRIPQGVLCLISALSFHELTTQVPHTVDVALTTFFSGEHEVRVIDPARVVLLAAIGCEVKTDG